MNSKIILIAGLLHFFFVSCSQEVVDGYDSCLQVAVTTKQHGRAIVESDRLPSGSQIGVSLFAADGTPYPGNSPSYSNVCYSSAPSAGGDIWNGVQEMLLSKVPAKGIAYYPYAASTDLNAFAVEADSQTDYMYSDWVTGLSGERPGALFSMNHALCMINLEIVCQPAVAGQVTMLNVSSPFLAKKGVFNILKSSYTSLQGAGEGLSCTLPFNLSGTSTRIKMLAVPNETGTIDIETRICINGNYYKAVLADASKSFKRGYIYNLRMEIPGNGKNGGVASVVGSRKGSSTVASECAALTLRFMDEYEWR